MLDAPPIYASSTYVYITLRNFRPNLSNSDYQLNFSLENLASRESTRRILALETFSLLPVLRFSGNISLYFRVIVSYRRFRASRLVWSVGVSSSRRRVASTAWQVASRFSIRG